MKFTRFQRYGLVISVAADNLTADQIREASDRWGAASGWTLRLRSKDGDAHLYDGDELERLIARAYLGGAPDRKESRYARD